MSIQNPKYKNIDDYIQTFPSEVQEVLNNLRKIIHQVASSVEEQIRYDMPSFKLGENLICHFAAFKNHIGVYGITMDSFKDELAPLLHSRGTIQFDLNKPIPYDLFKRIVETRVKEIKS